MTHDKLGNQRNLSNNNVRTEDERIVSVVKEEVSIGKRDIVTGEVNIRKTVKTETVDVPLTTVHTRYREERVPQNKEITDMPRTREEDGKIIIPVVREEAVITKRLVLVEEIHLTQVTEAEDRIETVEVRSDHVDIDRSSGS